MDKNTNNVIQEEEDISIKEVILKITSYLKYIWSRKIIIIIIGIIGGGIGFFYAYSKKKLYHATTTFVLESGDNSQGMNAYAGIASMVGINLGADGGGIFQGDNIMELYRSRTMLEKTLLSPIEGQEALIDLYLKINDKKKAWKNNPELSSITFKVDSNKKANKHTRLRDSVITSCIDDIRENYLIVTRPDKKLSIIKVVIKSVNENFSKVFNEELVKNVNDFYVQTKTKKSLDNIHILQQKTDSVRAVMNGAIYSAAVVADATPNLNPTRQVQRAVPIQRAQFSAEANKAILNEIVKNLEMTKISLMKETPLIQVIDQPIFPIPVTRVSKMMSIVIGGVVAGMLAIFYLVISKYIKSLGF